MKTMTLVAVLTAAVAAAVSFIPAGTAATPEGARSSPAGAPWLPANTGGYPPVQVVLGQAADQPEPDEPKDPNDVRNALDNLGLVRDMKKLAKPVAGGLWQDYVNQPYYTPEMKAEKLLFHGQYEDAEKAFKELLKKADLKPEQKTGLQMSLLAATLYQGHESDVGRFNKLLATMPDDVKKAPQVMTLRAEALIGEGKTAEARGLLKEFVDGVKDFKTPIRGDVLHAANLYAELLEGQSDYAAAKTLYGRIADLDKEDLPKDGQVQTEIIQAVYRASVLAGPGQNRKPYVLQRLAKVFQDDAAYWPAYLLSGKILLDSHNEKEGGQRIADVMSRNPNNLDAFYLSFDHAVEGYNFEQAEKVLDEIKDRSEGARVLAAEGRLLLKKRTPEKALEPLQEAVQKDPSCPEARGWLVATYYLLNENAKAEEQLAATQLEGRPNPRTVFETAEVLRDARQFPLAEKLYKQAKQTASWWAEPSSALAQLYLETGNEKEAREQYDISFKIDPTNIRAVNQLRLIDEFMSKFMILESPNFIDAERKMPRFIIKCAPEDQILAKLALEWLDSIYPEVTGYFHHTPSVPTIIEFFPDHDQFGVRTTGLPWIGTVGASTGNVIAMDVPRGQAKNMMGTFDWARVLRHEYTHTVTLSMTHNRIPHWLTEACACEQELSPRDWDNCQLLASNYRAGTLFNLDTLTWGFIKPKRSIDRRLAYMQSQWVYQYLVEAYGQPKMLDFLRAFGEGKTERQAYRAVYAKSADALSKEFLVWAGKQIEAWGLPSDPLPKKEDLDKALKANPDDVKAHFGYAWLLVNEGPRGLAKAKEHLEAAAKIEPTNTRVRELLGAILNNMGKRDEARTMLTKVVAEDPNRVVAVRTLGLIAMGQRDFDSAEKWFVKLQALRPAEDTSYLKLAGIYLLRKDTEKATAQFAQLQAHEQKDDVIPRRLALLYQQQGQLAEAQASAYRAVRINPYNAVDHHLLAQVYMAEREKETDEAKRKALATKAAEYWGYASELQPKIADFWEGLASAQDALGDAKAAEAAARKAVEIKPTSAAKKWIKE